MLLLVENRQLGAGFSKLVSNLKMVVPASRIKTFSDAFWALRQQQLQQVLSSARIGCTVGVAAAAAAAAGHK